MKTLSLLCLPLLSVAITFLAAERKWLLGGVESDYLDSFIIEAQRFLQGEPLLLKFHLPFYSILIATLNLFLHDWFVTGILISWLSGLSAAIFAFLFFKGLAGEWAGAGAALGFAGSPTFLLMAVSAGSDAFFLALSYACFLCAFLAAERGSRGWWLATGLLIGLAFLSRTNALGLLPLFALPWITNPKGRKRASVFAWMIVSFSLPLAIWFAYSKASHSPFFIQEAHLNLAMTYFSPGADRGTYDSYAAVKQAFGNFYDVISRNPTHMIKTYMSDFLVMIGRNFLLLVLLPINMIAVLGTRPLMRLSKRPFLWVFLISTSLQLLLANLIAYDDRFYLFLIPLAGALAGLFVEDFAGAKVFERNPEKTVKAAFLTLFLVAAFASTWLTAQKIHPPFEDELREAVPTARKLIPPKSIVVTRKPHLAYYTNSEHAYFPNAQTPEELRQFLTSLPTGRNVFLYFGFYERQMRNQFSYLSAGRKWDFLIPIAQSKDGEGWVLYRFATSEKP